MCKGGLLFPAYRCARGSGSGYCAVCLIDHFSLEYDYKIGLDGTLKTGNGSFDALRLEYAYWEAGSMIVDLDRNDSTPLYIQIKNRLADLIRSGQLGPGSRLPSTRELAGSMGVNRNTVISAYQELEVEGFVSSHVGRGTAVREHIPGSARSRRSRKGREHARRSASLDDLAQLLPPASRGERAAPGGRRRASCHLLRLARSGPLAFSDGGVRRSASSRQCGSTGQTSLPPARRAASSPSWSTFPGSSPGGESAAAPRK